MSPDVRGRALIAALLLAACGRERAPADTSALAGARERSITDLPSVDSIRGYARHLDSLAFRRQLRIIVHRSGDEADAEVWGYYSGDDLVIARGLTGRPTPLGYARVYLRAGAPVLFVLAPDASSQRSEAASGVAHWYLNADTVVEASGHAKPAELPSLLSLLASFRAELARPGRTVESVAADTLVARPRAPYLVHGACPFECCRYGEWTVESGAVLRREPGPGAAIVGTIQPGAVVQADSGLVALDTLGLVVVDRRLSDQEQGIDFAPGDSVLLLDYLGEGFVNAWLRGHRFSVSEFWDSAGVSGARLLRSPASRWWTHVTRAEDRDTLRGWMDMSDTVRVSGADACGG